VGGGVTAYWLDSDLPCKKVMCAASARSTEYSDLNDLQREILKKSVAGFDLLGVRDRATYELIDLLGGGGENLQMVPDPTFYHEIDHSFAERYFAARKIKFDKPTVALHMTRKFKWFLELAQIFRDRGWQILSLRPAKYADHVINDISPFEWAGAFHYYDLTITHRFHDTVYSYKNITPTLTIVPGKHYITETKDSKYHSLVNAFGLLDSNLVDDYTCVEAKDVFNAGINAIDRHDASLVKNKLHELRSEYVKFISKVVKLL
jgi:hypothetical protein